MASGAIELAKMGGRAGAGFAVHRARRVFASAERQAELDQEFELRTAEQVAEALGGMKGAFMKLGQMASYLDVGLPDHVRAALADLQQNAPPMSAELAAGVVERELGAPPDIAFAEWDPVPLASASIGQVHRAITHDDRAVAVKVQYPGVDEAIEADLEAAGPRVRRDGDGVLGLRARPAGRGDPRPHHRGARLRATRPATSSSSPTRTATTRSSTSPTW